MNTNGFTLLEMILVIIIIGILAVFAVPYFMDTASHNKNFYYDEVLSASRYAQKLALSSGCPVELTISAGGYALKMRDGSDGNCTTGAFNRDVENPGEGGAFASAPPSGVSLASTDSPIVFDAAGRATGISGALATVTVGGTETFRIITETGFVDVP